MVAKKKKETAVKPKEDQLPAAFAGAQGTGFEGADADSYAIPFLNILQSNSPAVEDELEGCKAGLIFNTVTERPVESCLFIPVSYKRRMVEWVKRDDGGGFCGEYAVGDPNMPKAIFNEETGKSETEDGHDLIDTRYHYGIAIYDDGEFEPALITMASTQLRKSKRWMSLMQGIKIGGQKAPTFTQAYSLSTMKEENEKGKWRGWVIKHDSPVTDESIAQAVVDFRQALMEGKVTVDMEQAAGAAAPEGEDEDY